MHTTQDDLLALHHLRAAWAGGERRIASGAALAAHPGRAEGRVAHWSFGRAASVLGAAARRRLVIAEGIVPSADERQLLRVMRALAEGDRRGAEAASLWLVRRDATAELAQALSPAACALHGRASPRRQNAASA